MSSRVSRASRRRAGSSAGQQLKMTRRRTWRKLHLGMDEASKQIVAVDLTTSAVPDGRWLPERLERTPADLYTGLGRQSLRDEGICRDSEPSRQRGNLADVESSLPGKHVRHDALRSDLRQICLFQPVLFH
jgi:hypothetical protein